MPIKFAAWCPPFDPHSGGNLVLNRLVHELTLLGEEAFLIADSKHPSWLGRLGTPNEIDDTTFCILPEIVCGNPFGAKRVVRWLLNTAGLLGGDGIYGENDLVFRYWNYFTCPDESKIVGELRTFDMQLDFWQDFGQPRSGSCHIIRKGHRKSLAEIDPYSTLIGGYTNDYLRQMFNQCEVFVSADDATFLSVQAALCGCLSVVLPNPNISVDEWREKLPSSRYGVAYGFDDIGYANSTRHLVRSHLEELEREALDTVKNFVRICKEKLES